MKSSPTAQTSSGAIAATPFRSPGAAGVGTTVQEWPSQCSASVADPSLDSPTAHASAAESAVTAFSWVKGNGLGDGTAVQWPPWNRSMMGRVRLFWPWAPTAHAWAVPGTRATPLIRPVPPAGCGVATRLKRDGQAAAAACGRAAAAATGGCRAATIAMPIAPRMTLTRAPIAATLPRVRAPRRSPSGVARRGAPAAGGQQARSPTPSTAIAAASDRCSAEAASPPAPPGPVNGCTRAVAAESRSSRVTPS